MAKKVRVEFELDLSDVVAMMQSGTTKTAKLSAAEVEDMAKRGALRAGDILSKKGAADLATTVAKLVKKMIPPPKLIQPAPLKVKQSLKVKPLKVKMISKMGVGPNNPGIKAGAGKRKAGRKG